MTDLDGDRSHGGDLVISIVDDAPVAVADTDSVAAGQTVAETGNVLTGAGTTSGGGRCSRRGWAAAGGAVVGVALGTGGRSGQWSGVGAAIAGAFGTLTLNADGSYSYVHRAAGGGNDVFTYTIRDADGSQSTATLNIAVADSSPGGISIPPEGVASAGTLVDEAGLGARGSEPAGWNPAAPTTTVGTIAFTSVGGGGGGGAPSRLRRWQQSALGLAKFCFRRAAVGRGLADAGICQNGLRNRIVD